MNYFAGGIAYGRWALDNGWPLMQIAPGMAVSLTPENKRTILRLLETGRWNNESEIMRYGLHLVNQEVQRAQLEQLAPIPKGALAEAYRRQTADERADEKRMARRSLRHRPRREDLDAA